MNPDKSRKNALITGSTKGIGLAVAERLLSEGYYVFMSYSNDEYHAKELTRKLEVNYKDRFAIDKVDLSDYQASMKYLEEIKIRVDKLDVLVLNAAVTHRVSFEDITTDMLEQSFRVSVTIPFLFVQNLLEKLKAGQDKSVVFTGTVLGIYPHALSIGYGVAKSAKHSLAKNLVKFLEPHGIRSNAIAFGFVETEMQKNKPQEIRDSICSKVALHRFATTQEAVDAFLFIINNTYINGSVLEIDGGYCYR